MKSPCLECPPLAGVARSAGGGSIDAGVLFVIQAAKVGYPSREDRTPSAITLKFLNGMFDFQDVFYSLNPQTACRAGF
jgi:hypothetical protein